MSAELDIRECALCNYLTVYILQCRRQGTDLWAQVGMKTLISSCSLCAQSAFGLQNAADLGSAWCCLPSVGEQLDTHSGSVCLCVGLPGLVLCLHVCVCPSLCLSGCGGDDSGHILLRL